MENHGKPWLPADDHTLINMFHRGFSTEAIASALQRTPLAIQLRHERLVTQEADVTELKFYMLYAANGGSPTIKHNIKAIAHKEAERLAIKLGEPVYVLEAVEVCVASNVRWSKLD